MVFEKAAYIEEIQTTLKEMAVQADIHRELGAEVEFLLKSEAELVWPAEDRVWRRDLPAFAKKGNKRTGRR